MPRVNNVHERIKDEITNNNRPKGWTSAELGLAIGVRTGSLRYVCRQLVEEGILIIKEIENPKKGECRIRYFRPLENGEDVYLLVHNCLLSSGVHNLLSLSQLQSNPSTVVALRLLLEGLSGGFPT